MSADTSKITAGVIGAGSLGDHHARIYSSLPGVAAVYICDIDGERAAAAARRWDARALPGSAELLERCDVVSICTPATVHKLFALEAFERGVHVLVEKPIAARSRDGEEMIAAASAAGCVLQVGHVERFNGAFEAAAGLVEAPRFIESHRLGTFTPRGTDVSVVVDLMIHDIDLVLSLLGGDPLVELRASGAGVLTGSPDIVNARLEFAAGCVANLTASRISREPLRKIRFFRENLYVSVDLRGRTVEAFSRAEEVDPQTLADDPRAFIRPIDVAVDTSEPLVREIASFIAAVRTGTEPVVTGADGLAALRIAEMILERIGPQREEA